MLVITASAIDVAGNLSALYTRYIHAVDVSVTAGGSVTNYPAQGRYLRDDTVSLTARPDPGYHFERWTEGGNFVSESNPYGFTVKTNRAFTAEFGANTNSYEIALSYSPTVGGSITHGGTYAYGTTATVVATAATNYRFTVTTNRTLVAEFSIRADKDNDGMADDWERQYLGPQSNVHPGDDPDKDGASNLQEFIAGTDPTSPLSRPCIAGFRFVDSVPVLSIDSVSGRRYKIQYTENMTHWLDMDTNTVSGLDAPLDFFDLGGTNPAAGRFYRLTIGE